MEPKELFLMKAEADARYLRSKLDQVEADALDGIANAEARIHSLEREIEACIDKKNNLIKRLEYLKNANEGSWLSAKDKFIEAIESLEDKSVFKTKTNDWFNKIRRIGLNLQEEVRENFVQC